MESKALSWVRNKNPKNETTAAAVTMTSLLPSPDSNPLHCELSCVMVSKIPNDICCHTFPMSIMLDSGSTSHLVMDKEYFMDFREEERPPVKTAHGSLITTGCGMCIGELVINSEKYHLTLNNCLHALGTLLILLSVGCMLGHGWDCEFKGSRLGITAHCQLFYHGEALGAIPMVGNLCYVDLCLLHPNELINSTSFTKEISAIAKPAIMWDTWHAHMGHPGRESVKCLPLVVTGVTVDSQLPLHRCEACIMAKHPGKPFPPSETPHASNMLDLIHSDLCGPFPV